MLFLLLVYSLTQSNPGDASPIPSVKPRADSACNDLNNCQTIWSITWSCLSTIILCTWVTLHPNIAIARDTRGMGSFKQSVVHPLFDFMKNKLVLFLCGLIAPECILAWAVRQYLMAGNIQQKVPGWTRTHGFLLIMGGFHLYRLPTSALSNPYPQEFNLPTGFDTIQPLTPHSREQEIAEHPLGFADLSVHALTYLAPTETEIKDKAKADVLAKLITLLQTLWFVVQCIARRVEHLPLTEIEVVTLAYATMNLFIYYFWWHKPKDLACPVRVYKMLGAQQVEKGGKEEWNNGVFRIWTRLNIYIVGTQDRFFRLSDEIQVPMFWSGNPGPEIQVRAMLGSSIVGVVFGAIHFTAWNSEFPSRIELILWWISCIAMTANPLLITVNCFIIEMKLTEKKWAQLIGNAAIYSVALAAPLYLFARIATLVIAFTTLRALPLDAFKTVNWTTFIPRF